MQILQCNCTSKVCTRETLIVRIYELFSVFVVVVVVVVVIVVDFLFVKILHSILYTIV